MTAPTKKRKPPVKLALRPKAFPVPARKPQLQERKAKVIAALKRLHPMD